MKSLCLKVALAASLALPCGAQFQQGVGPDRSTDRKQEAPRAGEAPRASMQRRQGPAAEGRRPSSDEAAKKETQRTEPRRAAGARQEAPRSEGPPKAREGARNEAQAARLAALRNELEALGKTLRQHDAQRAEYVARLEALRKELRSVEAQRGVGARKEAPAAGKERAAAPPAQRAQTSDRERRPEAPRKDVRRGSDAKPKG